MVKDLYQTDPATSRSSDTGSNSNIPSPTAANAGDFIAQRIRRSITAKQQQTDGAETITELGPVNASASSQPALGNVVGSGHLPTLSQTSFGKSSTAFPLKGESIFAPEKQGVKAEALPPEKPDAETHKIPEIPKPAPFDATNIIAQLPDPTKIPQEKPPKNIVDKTKGRVKTHPIDPKADSLTTLADTKEEEFIEKVELEHAQQ